MASPLTNTFGKTLQNGDWIRFVSESALRGFNKNNREGDRADKKPAIFDRMYAQAFQIKEKRDDALELEDKNKRVYIYYKHSDLVMSENFRCSLALDTTIKKVSEVAARQMRTATIDQAVSSFGPVDFSFQGEETPFGCAQRFAYERDPERSEILSAIMERVQSNEESEERFNELSARLLPQVLENPRSFPQIFDELQRAMLESSKKPGPV